MIREADCKRFDLSSRFCDQIKVINSRNKLINCDHFFFRALCLSACLYFSLNSTDLFFLVSDPDKDEVRCRLAESAKCECAGVCHAFPGAVLNKVKSSTDEENVFVLITLSS